MSNEEKSESKDTEPAVVPEPAQTEPTDTVEEATAPQTEPEAVSEQETATPSDEAPEEAASDARTVTEDEVQALSPDALACMIRESIAPVVERLEQVDAALGVLAEEQRLIPAQVRQLRAAVGDAATTLGAPRVRDILVTLLLIHDITEQSLRAADSSGVEAVPVNDVEVVQNQVLQSLAVNGFEEIPAEGLFDPHLHKAIKTVPCTDELEEGQIVKVLRKGFRSATGAGILRYAEVVMATRNAAEPDESKAAEEKAAQNEHNENSEQTE